MMTNVWKTTKIAVLASMMMSTSLHATAQSSAQTIQGGVGIVEDIGAADRIKHGERLRTLSQALASAACHLNAGVDVGPSKMILKKGIKEFDHLSESLRTGNPDLNIIGEEVNPKTQRAMDRLQKEWMPMKAAYSAVLQSGDDVDALTVVYSGNEGLLKWINILTNQLETQYSNPAELLGSDALMLKIAGKQAMATQRLSYDACKIWSNSQTDQDVADLRELVEQFEFAVLALKDGRPELGLEAAPTPEISKKLSSVISDWDDISWKLNQLADNGTITPEEAQKMCRTLYKKMVSMQKVTHLYTEYSRRVY